MLKKRAQEQGIAKPKAQRWINPRKVTKLDAFGALCGDYGSYQVQLNLGTKEQAANQLAQLNRSINNFIKAPAGPIDMYKAYPCLGPISVAPITLLEKLAMEGRPQLQRWFHRQPKKRDLRNTARGPVARWTTGNYKRIQNLRRGAAVTDPRSQRDERWLQTYMTRHALRSPARPLRAPDTPLYRGVRLTDAQLKKLLTTGRHTDAGYMAFTRDSDHASSFGSRKTKWNADNFVFFELSLSDVARGTPWIWYAGKDSAQFFHSASDFQFAGWNIPTTLAESEVLLPPGTITVKSFKSIETKNVTAFSPKRLERMFDRKNSVDYQVPSSFSWVHIAFTPAPEFAWKPPRKGTREENSNILWNVFAPIKRNRSNAPAQAAKQRAKRSRR